MGVFLEEVVFELGLKGYLKFGHAKAELKVVKGISRSSKSMNKIKCFITKLLYLYQGIIKFHSLFGHIPMSI